MSQRSKRELLEEIHSRYIKAKKPEKKAVLDEFVATTDTIDRFAPKCETK